VGLAAKPNPRALSPSKMRDPKALDWLQSEPIKVG